MKKRFIVLAIVLSLSLTGCFCSREEKYECRQEFDQIVSIDILRKDYDSIDASTPAKVIKTIPPEEHKALIDALLELEGFRIFCEPSRGIGLYYIRITYKDNEQEMIGNYNNAYITPDGKIYEVNYTFHREQFFDLVSRFLGEEITDYTYG